MILVTLWLFRSTAVQVVLTDSSLTPRPATEYQTGNRSPSFGTELEFRDLLQTAYSRNITGLERVYFIRAPTNAIL